MHMQILLTGYQVQVYSFSQKQHTVSCTDPPLCVHVSGTIVCILICIPGYGYAYAYAYSDAVLHSVNALYRVCICLPVFLCGRGSRLEPLCIDSAYNFCTSKSFSDTKGTPILSVQCIQLYRVANYAYISELYRCLLFLYATVRPRYPTCPTPLSEVPA